MNRFQQKKGRALHLIFGGANKELDFDGISQYLSKRTDVSIYLLAGTAHEKIIQSFAKHKTAFVDCANLDDVFRAIKTHVKKGDLVLLSPGCASFGLFQNEYHRGEEFKKRVKKWR